MSGIAGDVIAAVFVLALVYLLVRPRSGAVDTVNAIAGALTALVRSATNL